MFTNDSCLFTFFQIFHFRVDQENRASNMFSQDVLPQIFANIKSIYKFHAEFLLPQVGPTKFYFSVLKCTWSSLLRHTKSSTIELTSFDQFLMSCKSFLAFQKLLEDIFAPILDAPHIDFSLSWIYDQRKIKQHFFTFFLLIICSQIDKRND